MRIVIALLSLFCTSAFGQAWDGILAPERAIDWSSAGIPGGIPTTWANCTTTACNTLYNSPTSGSGFSANVNAAIASAPASTVVRIPAGSFTMTASIYSNRSNVILRGAGTMQTNIDGGGYNFVFGNGTAVQGNYEWGQGSVSWTGGLTRGSTVLTVSSTTNIRAGQTIIIDQLNPAWVFPLGSQAQCSSGNSCGRCASSLYGGCDNRALGQMTRVVSVDSSTQITILDPVGYTHSSELTPQVFYWDACQSATEWGNCQYMGIEDLWFQAKEASWSINFAMCDYCWAKNVVIHDAGRGAPAFLYSYGGELRNSYIDNEPQLSAPTQYGFHTIGGAKHLAINNIFFAVTAAVLPQASYGTVVAYNYARQSSLSENFFANFQPHLAHNAFHLYEGNVLDGINFDVVWGSSSHGTMFRNRVNGYGNNKTSPYRSAVKVMAHNRFYSYVGNVLGDTTFSTKYSCTPNSLDETSTDGWIWILGIWGSSTCGTAGAPWDSVVYTSAMRWGNWDAVTYDANGDTNGVRYCTANETDNAECTEDERGSGDPTFPALANPSTSLPASFILSSKPAWFGSVAWPAIGPDVSCSGAACDTNAGGRAYMIPAQLCYNSSSKNTDGLLTSFDPESCYADSAVRPEPPTNVIVTQVLQ